MHRIRSKWLLASVLFFFTCVAWAQAQGADAFTGAASAPAAVQPLAASEPVAASPVAVPPAPLVRPGLVPQDSLNGADTAWMMTSTALVLLMTLPGIALFYGGMVRKKNVLNTMASVVAVAALVSLLWFAVGYSLAFTPGSGWLGGAVGCGLLVWST
jgi:Amt family ammonium transporter